MEPTVIITPTGVSLWYGATRTDAFSAGNQLRNVSFDRIADRVRSLSLDQAATYAISAAILTVGGVRVLYPTVKEFIDLGFCSLRPVAGSFSARRQENPCSILTAKLITIVSVALGFETAFRVIGISALSSRSLVALTGTVLPPLIRIPLAAIAVTLGSAAVSTAVVSVIGAVVRKIANSSFFRSRPA